MSPNQTSNPSPTQANATQEEPLMFPRIGNDIGTVAWSIFIVIFCLAVLGVAWPVFPFVVGIFFMIFDPTCRDTTASEQLDSGDCG